MTIRPLPRNAGRGRTSTLFVCQPMARRPHGSPYQCYGPCERTLPWDGRHFKPRADGAFDAHCYDCRQTYKDNAKVARTKWRHRMRAEGSTSYAAQMLFEHACWRSSVRGNPITITAAQI